VLSRGNRASPQLFFSIGLKFDDNIHYKFNCLRVAKLRKPGFRVPNIPPQNRI